MGPGDRNGNAMGPGDYNETAIVPEVHNVSWHRNGTAMCLRDQNGPGDNNESRGP